jgi:formate dehydrogenase subunit beta
MADWESQERILREKAKELLSAGKVGVVIGYGSGSRPGTTMPVFIRRAEDVDRLVWGPHCHHNLAVYLTRKEVRILGRPAVVAMGCTARAVVVQIQEGQLKREDVEIIGMACEGMGDPLFRKCGTCDVRTPKEYDVLVGNEIGAAEDGAPDPVREKLEAADPAERWRFWGDVFERCIRCYACRAACPLCYCERCIVEKNQPQWVSSAPEAKGNLNWNMTRAMHLAGRCVECEACERACPVDIPLMLLNREVSRIVEDSFGYRAGYDKDAKPAMVDYDSGDKAEFIR